MSLRPHLWLPIVWVLVWVLAGCQREAAPDTTATPAEEATAPQVPPPPNDTPAGQRIEADVRFLASDALAGRQVGTPGYEQAAEYVARRYADIGLLPAGDDGSYFQRVPLVQTIRAREGARLVVNRGGRSIALRFLDQFIHDADPALPATAVEAPAVFVGQAIHAPALGHDDFAGLDLRGKIAVMFPDAPATFDNDLRAHYSSQQTKLEAVAERGAIGTLLVLTPDVLAGHPWDNKRANWERPDMHLVDDDGSIVDGFPQLRAGAVVNAPAADLLFADTGRTAAELFDAVKQGRAKGFDLPGTIAIAGRSHSRRLTSRNVVARLPGSDATLAQEVVVNTAHLDHLGTGVGVEGDTIYNGALDNALGVAVMLEVANGLQQLPVKPRRSSLFIALTAEEHGLLGARWFTHRPTVPAAALVANINIDMPMLTAPTTDVVPIGIEHSTLRAVVEAAARDIGVQVSPDPFPEEVVFVRSDQYAFVRAGIPAVYLDGGVVGANAGQDPKRAITWFLRNCYHKPCDQVDLPIHYDDAARLARLSARINQIVADAQARPQWNPGNFFGTRFGTQATPTSQAVDTP